MWWKNLKPKMRTPVKLMLNQMKVTKIQTSMKLLMGCQHQLKIRTMEIMVQTMTPRSLLMIKN